MSKKPSATQVASRVIAALEYLAGIAKLAPFAAQKKSSRTTKITEGLNQLLNDPDINLRRMACYTYLAWQLSQQFEDGYAIIAFFEQLEGQEMIKKCPERRDDQFRFDDSYYVFSSNAGLGIEEILELAGKVEPLAKQVSSLRRLQRQAETEKLWQESGVDPDNLQSGMPGKCAIRVPAEPVFEPGTSTVKSWRSGGVILVESDGRDIRPITAVGNPRFESAVREAAKMGVFLFVESLSENHPPSIRRSDLLSKLRFLWHALRRGIDVWQEEQDVANWKCEMENRASVSMADFFLDHKPGVCLVELDGTWLPPDSAQSYTNVFFLVSREEAGEDSAMTIVDVPLHLETALYRFVGEKFPQTDRFYFSPARGITDLLNMVVDQTAEKTSRPEMVLEAV